MIKSFFPYRNHILSYCKSHRPPLTCHNHASVFKLRLKILTIIDPAKRNATSPPTKNYEQLTRSVPRRRSLTFAVTKTKTQPQPKTPRRPTTPVTSHDRRSAKTRAPKSAKGTSKSFPFIKPHQDQTPFLKKNSEPSIDRSLILNIKVSEFTSSKILI